MITVTTTVFKKTTLALIGLACAAGIVFSVGLSHQSDTEVRAATTNTHRVWVNTTEAPSYWFDAGAVTGIHYWGTGVDDYAKVIFDSANSTYYYDIPAISNDFQFLRIGPSNEHWSFLANQTYGSGTFWLHTDGSVGYDGSATHATTTIVSNFAATIDTDTEACSAASAQAAVNAYNALSTFEQDQFDVLSVGGGFTGLQRLNFLKTFYSIATPLNINNIGDSNNSDDSLMTMLIIGAIGLTTLGGYYVISRKKHLA